MTKIRLVSCDDEPLALARLRRFLAEMDDVELVGEALDGATGEQLVADLAPDALLVDVEMPECDGITLVRRIAAQELAHPPLIVFVTAYSRFALDAFDTGAIDFLTKPLRRERLRHAIDRVIVAVADRNAQRRLDELTAKLDRANLDESPMQFDRRIWVRRGGELVGVPFAEVDRIVAEREYVRLHWNGREYLHRCALSALEPNFVGTDLVRVHRSHAIAARTVASICRGGSDPVLITLTGERVPVGRKYRSAVDRILRLTET